VQLDNEIGMLSWVTSPPDLTVGLLADFAIDGYDKTLRLGEDERPLLDGRALTLRGRAGLLLPLNVAFGDVRVVYSTAEVVGVAPSGLAFRLTQAEDNTALETERQILPDASYHAERDGERLLVRSRKHALVDDRLTLRFASL
jgi:beta-galactosidase